MTAASTTSDWTREWREIAQKTAQKGPGVPRPTGSPDSPLVRGTVQSLRDHQPPDDEAKQLQQFQDTFEQQHKDLERILRRRLLRLGYPEELVKQHMQEVSLRLSSPHTDDTYHSKDGGEELQLERMAMGYLNHQLIDEWRKKSRKQEQVLPEDLRETLSDGALGGPQELRLMAQELWDWICWLSTIPHGISERQVEIMRLAMEMELNAAEMNEQQKQSRYRALGFKNRVAYQKELARVRLRLQRLHKEPLLQDLSPPAPEPSRLRMVR